MKRRLRTKSKGYSSKPFVMLRHDVIESENFRDLSGRAVKLLVQVCYKYRGHNNGDISIVQKLMRDGHGWSSNDQLFKAIKELERTGFLIRTRQGGRNKATLYALSFHPIDECSGKHDLAPTKRAPDNWRKDFESTSNN